MNVDSYEHYDFANRRHIGPSPEEIAEMLAVLGVSSLNALIDETVPEDIRLHAGLDFGKPLSERGALDRLRETASKNRVLTSLIGQGYHGTIMPPAIQRNILENPAWYTAYTPYQPEISQGRLEALLNFQTVVSDLTALDIANASLLDRRGDGGSRGDGACSSRLEIEGDGFFRRRKLPTADDRRGAHARRAARLEDHRRRSLQRFGARTGLWRARRSGSRLRGNNRGLVKQALPDHWL
jgi:hypothetical protein